MLLGAATVAGTAVAVEAFSRWVIFIPNPGVFLLLSIAIAGFLWGLAAALAGTPVAIAAALYFYADAGAWMRYKPDNVVRVIVLSVGAPMTALIVGVLKARADRALSASEGRYAALFHATPDAVLVQQDERILYANDACHELFGAVPDGAAGRRFVGSMMWDWIHPDSHALVRGRLPELTPHGSGQTPPVEQAFLRPDGTTFVAEVTGRRVQYAGRPAALVVLHDLTRRRAMEAQIRARVDDLSLLQEASRAFLFGLPSREIPDYLCALVVDRLGFGAACVVLIDPDGRPSPGGGRACDPAVMIRAYHAGRDATPGAPDAHPARRAIHAARPVVVNDVTTDPTYAPWRDAAARLGYRATAAFPLIGGDRVIAVLCVYAPHPGSITPGRADLVQALANLAAIALAEALAHESIAARADELERAVARRTAEVRAAAAEMQAFTYSVSHDLRAPLRAMTGFAEILLRRHADAIPDGGRHYLDNIVTAGVHMSKLIDDLLAYARLGRRGAEALRVDLNWLVERITSDLAPRVAETGGALRTPADLPAITTDPTLLRQILTNLLDNALTYHPPNRPPDVTLTYEPATDGGHVFRVADRGIGIPPEHRETIFNIFQRLHSQDQFRGTGIGLAVVRKSAALLGGDVSVESAVGTGSTFTVRLPASPPAGASPPGEGGAA